MNPQPSSVVQLPLSGRAAQTGSVSVTQSTTNTGGGNTVNRNLAIGCVLVIILGAGIYSLTTMS